MFMVIVQFTASRPTYLNIYSLCYHNAMVYLAKTYNNRSQFMNKIFISIIHYVHQLNNTPRKELPHDRVRT